MRNHIVIHISAEEYQNLKSGKTDYIYRCYELNFRDKENIILCDKLTLKNRRYVCDLINGRKLNAKLKHFDTINGKTCDIPRFKAHEKVNKYTLEVEKWEK